MATETVSRLHYDQIKQSLGELTDAYNAFGQRVEAELHAAAQRFAAHEREMAALDDIFTVSAPSLLSLAARQSLEVGKQEWEQRFRRLYGISE